MKPYNTLHCSQNFYYLVLYVYCVDMRYIHQAHSVNGACINSLLILSSFTHSECSQHKIIDTNVCSIDSNTLLHLFRRAGKISVSQHILPEYIMISKKKLHDRESIPCH